MPSLFQGRSDHTFTRSEDHHVTGPRSASNSGSTIAVVAAAASVARANTSSRFAPSNAADTCTVARSASNQAVWVPCTVMIALIPGSL